MVGINIKNRITGLIIFLSMLLLAVGFYGILGMKTIDDKSEWIYHNRIIPLYDLRVIQDMYTVNIIDTTQKVHDNIMTWEDGLRKITEAKRVIDVRWMSLRSVYHSLPERQLIIEMEPLIRKSDYSIEKLERIIIEKNSFKLAGYIDKDLYSEINPVALNLNRLHYKLLSQAIEEKSVLNDVYKSSKRDVFIFISIMILIAVFFTRRLILAITRPLEEEVRLRRDAERLFTYYVDNIDAYIYMEDKDFNYTFINKKTEKLFNISRDELKKRRYNDYDFFDRGTVDEKIHKNNRKVIDEGQSLTLEEGGIAEGNVNSSLKVGRKYYLGLKFPLKDEFGNIMGLCGFSYDITEQKETESKLKEQEVLFRNVFNIAPIGIGIINKEVGITYLNPEAQKIWQGGKYLAIEQFGEYKGWWLSNGKPLAGEDWAAARAINKGETSIDEEIEIECFDGTHKIISHYGSPLYDSNGEIYGSFVSFLDITGRKNTEELNRLQGQMVQYIAEGAILIRADDGTIVYTNPKFDSIFGYNAGELLGRHVSILNAPTVITPEETAREIIALLSEYGIWRGEILNIHKNGSVFWSHSTVSEFDHYKYGKVWISIHTDISERKRMELQLRDLNLNLQRKVDEEVEKNKSKDRMMFEQSRHAALGELLINISHHWRQPLGGIAASVQDMLDAYRHGEFDEGYLNSSVKVILNELTSLSSTIDTFMGIYRQDNVRKIYNASEVISDTIRAIEAYLRSMNIVLGIEIDPSIRITGYSSDFTQVLLNLVSNAREVIRERGIDEGQIHISLSRDSEKNMAVLIVADNGGGIDEKIIDMIFDPYFTTRFKDRNVGLGLYTVRNIVERDMAGHISVRNIAGGCEFKVEVPCER